MKQLNIYNREARTSPPEFIENLKHLVIPLQGSREFCTRSGIVVTVEHVQRILSGVGQTKFYRINVD